ncbi:hypothetical protein BXZ70DRAFT_910814 [Cristinia sonorae]|uniref:Uncharacterized protein n=1 Tax=Cristinia sonorae TaxID=1940300 RepID=A0A8K0UFP1_9AGAR|nr:hypothetical protein BXZ70DRAFT_910814 [Cristinia sonorae]
MAPNKTFKLKASHIQWLLQRDYLKEYVLLRKEQKSDDRAKRMADAVARTAQDLMVEFKVDGAERATVIKAMNGWLSQNGSQKSLASLVKLPKAKSAGELYCDKYPKKLEAEIQAVREKHPTLISCNVHNRAVRNIYQALSKKERNYWEEEAERMKETMQLTVEEKRLLADTSLETFVKNVQTVLYRRFHTHSVVFTGRISTKDGPHINVQAYDLPATVAGARYFHGRSVDEFSLDQFNEFIEDVFSAEATALGIELQDRDDSPGSKKTVPNIELETDDDGYPLLPEDVLQPEGRTGAGKLKYQRKVLREFIRLHYVIASNGLKNRVPWSLLTDSETVGDLIHPKYLPEDCPALIDPSRMVERDIAMLLGHWLHRQNDSRVNDTFRFTAFATGSHGNTTTRAANTAKRSSKSKVSGGARGRKKTVGQAKKKARRNEESSDDESSDDESSDDNRSDDDTSDEDISPEIDDDDEDDEDDDEDKEEEHNMEAAREEEHAGDQQVRRDETGSKGKQRATEQEIAEFEMEEHFTGRMPTPDLISAMAAASPAQPTAATPMQSAARMMPNLAAQTLSPSPAASGLKRVTGTITATAQGPIIKPAAHVSRMTSASSPQSSGFVNTPQLIGAGPIESPTTSLEMANVKCPSQVEVSILARKAFLYSLCSDRSFVALVDYHFAHNVLHTETEFQAIEGGKRWYRWTYKKPHPPQKLLEKPANEYLEWLQTSFASKSLIRKNKLVYTGVQMEMLLINTGMLWRHATMLGRLPSEEKKIAAGSSYWAKMDINSKDVHHILSSAFDSMAAVVGSSPASNKSTAGTSQAVPVTEDRLPLAKPPMAAAPRHPTVDTRLQSTTASDERVISMDTGGGKMPETPALAEGLDSETAPQRSKYGGGAVPRPATKSAALRGLEDESAVDGPPAPGTKNIGLSAHQAANVGDEHRPSQIPSPTPPMVMNLGEQEVDVDMAVNAAAIDMSGPSHAPPQEVPVEDDGMVDMSAAAPRSRSGRTIQLTPKVVEARRAAEEARKMKMKSNHHDGETTQLNLPAVEEEVTEGKGKKAKTLSKAKVSTTASKETAATSKSAAGASSKVGVGKDSRKGGRDGDEAGPSGEDIKKKSSTRKRKRPDHVEDEQDNDEEGSSAPKRAQVATTSSAKKVGGGRKGKKK